MRKFSSEAFLNRLAQQQKPEFERAKTLADYMDGKDLTVCAPDELRAIVSAAMSFKLSYNAFLDVGLNVRFLTDWWIEGTAPDRLSQYLYTQAAVFAAAEKFGLDLPNILWHRPEEARYASALQQQQEERAAAEDAKVVAFRPRPLRATKPDNGGEPG